MAFLARGGGCEGVMRTGRGSGEGAEAGRCKHGFWLPEGVSKGGRGEVSSFEWGSGEEMPPSGVQDAGKGRFNKV